MSGDILQAPPWHLDGSWSSSAKPVADDAAIISNAIGDDQTIVDTGGTADGIDLDILQTHPLFNGDFGSSGAPIRTAADLIQVFGGGGFHFECSSGGVSLKTDRIEIAAANAGAPIEIGSKSGAAGDVDEIYVSRGNVLLKSNIMFGDTLGRVVVGRVESDRDVKLTIDSGADTLPVLDVSAGSVVARNVVTALRIGGGVVTKKDAKAVTIDVYAGYLFYDHAAISGDSTVIRVYPGATLHLWGNALQKTLTQVVLMCGSTIVFSEHTKVHNILSLIDMGARRITSESIARQMVQSIRGR